MTANIEKETWQAYVPYFVEAQQKLEQTDWFINNGWQYVTWENTRFDTVSGQLYKANWFNHKRNGIHFDSWIGPKELEQHIIPVALHAHGDFPGGKKIIPFLAESVKLIAQDWEGCTITPGSPFQPLILKLPFTKETLVAQLLKMYAQVAQLGTTIDYTIAETTGKL